MDKFWRTVIKVEVLSAGPTPPRFSNLAQVHHAITTGDCSGDFDSEQEEVTRGAMRDLLVNQGSDPSFLLGEDE